MTNIDWLPIVLPLAGAALACLVLLLPPRGRLVGGPLSQPLWGAGSASIFLLLFTAVVLVSDQFDPQGDWASLGFVLDFGGTGGLLMLALLPATRDAERGAGRAGFGPLAPSAVSWLLLLMAGVAVFRIVLLTYVPCRQCPDLDPDQLGWAGIAISVTFSGFFVPLAEEVLYRGIALPLMAERVGGWAAVLLAAVSWAMAHGETPLLPLIVLGIALGRLTLVTGSLWGSIGFHAAWNGSVLVYEIYSQVAGVIEDKPFSAWVIFLAVAGLVLGWARLLDAARSQGLRVAPAGEQPVPPQGVGGKGGGP
jgi:membrane protease YdiL (CAAX protease family)